MISSKKITGAKLSAYTRVVIGRKAVRLVLRVLENTWSPPMRTTIEGCHSRLLVSDDLSGAR